jgi:ATP adenylyltransferase
VPRWDADTNFMTTVAETRVLPEALPDTLARIRAAWEH